MIKTQMKCEIIESITFIDLVSLFSVKDLSKLKEAGCIIEEKNIIIPAGIKNCKYVEDDVSAYLLINDLYDFEIHFDTIEERDEFIKIS